MTIGILGGTFDPFHHGHLRLAIECREQLQLESLRLVPLNQPPHRPPPAVSAAHRLAMLQRVVDGYDFMQVDECELQREGVSYSIDTVRDLRQKSDDEPLCLLLGRDAFNGLDSWKGWQQIIELVHIVVVERPVDRLEPSGTLSTFIDKYRTRKRQDLWSLPCGRLFELRVPLLDISATDIREKIGCGQDPSGLVPQPVLDYIRQHSLYRENHQ